MNQENFLKISRGILRLPLLLRSVALDRYRPACNTLVGGLDGPAGDDLPPFHIIRRGNEAVDKAAGGSGAKRWAIRLQAPSALRHPPTAATGSRGSRPASGPPTPTRCDHQECPQRHLPRRLSPGSELAIRRGLNAFYAISQAVYLPERPRRGGGELERRVAPTTARRPLRRTLRGGQRPDKKVKCVSARVNKSHPLCTYMVPIGIKMDKVYIPHLRRPVIGGLLLLFARQIWSPDNGLDLW